MEIEEKSKSKIFPVIEYLFFDNFNLNGFLNRIRKLNEEYK